MKKSKIALRCVLIALASVLVVFAAVGFAACDGFSSNSTIKIQDTTLDLDYVTTYTDGEILYEREGDEFTVVGIDQEYGGEEIVIPDTVMLNGTEYPVVAIASNAFYKYSLRTSVVISDNVKSIGSYAFSNCTGLESLSIGKGVASIGSYAFGDCTNVSEIYYDAASAYVSSNSFNNVGNDAEDGLAICIGRDVVSVPDSFCRYMFNVTDVIFEGGSVCESIGSYAFYNCTRLGSVSLPDAISSIGNYAFYGCGSLWSIIIPSGVETIGQNVFGSCESLSAIYYCGSAEDWSEIGGTKNIPSGVTLYYYSETQPDGENYWHYNANGEAVVWRTSTDVTEEEPEEETFDEGMSEEGLPE